MPYPKAEDVYPPESWESFEDLWRRIWNDPGAQKNGRQGQPQHGVDVFGRPGQGGEWAGVQCKKKGHRSTGRLTRGEIEREVARAREFNPRLSRFTLVTTDLRDAEVQQAAREITAKQLEDGSFPVEVVSWNDVWRELTRREDLLALYYPDLGDRSAVTLRDEYLRALWSRLSPVQIVGVADSGGGRDAIPLSAVYTALDVTAEVGIGGKGRGAGVLGGRGGPWHQPAGRRGISGAAPGPSGERSGSGCAGAPPTAWRSGVSSPLHGGRSGRGGVAPSAPRSRGKR